MTGPLLIEFSLTCICQVGIDNADIEGEEEATEY